MRDEGKSGDGGSTGSSAPFATMLASAPSFLAWITTDGNIRYVNRLAPGFTLQDVVGNPIYDFIPQGYHERARRALRDAIETRQVQEFSTMGVISDAAIGHYLTQLSPIVEGDEVTSLVLVSTDVTELEDRRMRLQLALDATGLGMWTYDPALGRGTWDERTRQIFGVDAGPEGPPLHEAMKKHVHPEDAGRVEEALLATLETGVYPRIQHRLVQPDGATRWVEASGVGVRGDDGSVSRIVGSIVDITERRMLEKRAAESARLESVGRLAGGVAHDFNNLLTAILANAQFALEHAPAGDSELVELLDEIRVGAERSAALTEQLLAFARRQVSQPKVVDPNELVQRIDALLGRVIGENVRLRVTRRATANVSIDPSQYEQLVMNLVTNARDALPGGGTIDVETRDASVGSDLRPDLEPGDYVVLSVTDDGRGIPRDLLPHVFEPFFSTREGGTGLGLATCYGIAKQNGGHVRVESQVGEGTRFEVFLPRSTHVAESTEAPGRGAAPGGTERVLIVEDEPAVRRVIEHILAGAGYEVVTADGPEQALAKAAKTHPFALLVTDVVMPGMDGAQLADRLGETSATARTLFVSGYTADDEIRARMREGKARFLAKPFLPVDLLTTVRAMLDGR